MAKLEQREQKKPSLPALLIKGAFAAALILLGLNWPRLLAGKSALIERDYSESIYQAIRRGISAVTSLVPFSIAEFLLYALVVGVSLLLLTRLVQLILRKIPFRRLLGMIASILLAGGIVLNLFYATWGFNYFREPLAARMACQSSRLQTSPLATTGTATASRMRAIHSQCAGGR